MQTDGILRLALVIEAQDAKAYLDTVLFLMYELQLRLQLQSLSDVVVVTDGVEGRQIHRADKLLPVAPGVSVLPIELGFIFPHRRLGLRDHACKLLRIRGGSKTDGNFVFMAVELIPKEPYVLPEELRRFIPRQHYKFIAADPVQIAAGEMPAESVCQRGQHPIAGLVPEVVVGLMQSDLVRFLIGFS